MTRTNLFTLIVLIALTLIISWDKSRAYDPSVLSAVTTTNATPANILTLPVATGQTIRIVVDILGSTGNDRYRGRKTACIKNIGGTLTIVGSTVEDIITPVSDASLTNASFNISVSGTNIVVPVTGVAATTIVWNSNTTFILN